MLSNLDKAIIATITYFDIFDYPVTVEELWRYLHKFKVLRPRRISLGLKKLIGTKEGLYFLSGRKRIVECRKKRNAISAKKYIYLEKAVRIIKHIPSIKLIGLSGTMAMNNSDRDDDIDLFIVTAKDCLWITRFFCILLLDIFGMRRKPGSCDVKDKICLNMFADEAHLGIPENERDIFSAHEILQMKPVFERDNIYIKFIRKNGWVEQYLPNAYYSTIQQFSNSAIKNDKRLLNCYIVKPALPAGRLLNCLENIFKKFQLWYMKKRKTNEVIRDGYLRFHPDDIRKKILPRLKLPS